MDPDNNSDDSTLEIDESPPKTNKELLTLGKVINTNHRIPVQHFKNQLQRASYLTGHKSSKIIGQAEQTKTDPKSSLATEVLMSTVNSGDHSLRNSVSIITTSCGDKPNSKRPTSTEMDTSGNTLTIPKPKQIQNIQKATLEKANSAPNGLLLFKQKTIRPMTSGSLDTALSNQPCISVPNVSQPVEIPGIDLLRNTSKNVDETVKNHVCKQLAYFVQNSIIFRGKECGKLKSMVSSLSSDYRYYWIITANSVLEGKTGPSCQPNQHIITFNDRLRLPWVCHACKRRGMTLSDVVLHVAAEHKKQKILIHDLEGNKLSDFFDKSARRLFAGDG